MSGPSPPWSYLRRNHKRGAALLDIERTALLDPDYFLALCNGLADRCGLLVPGNVARATLGAVASGVEKPGYLNDGISNVAVGQFREPVRVKHGGLVRLSRIRIELNAIDGRHYFRYLVRVSQDGRHWELVCDRSRNGRWKRWQKIDFSPCPVQFIEVVGTFNSTGQSTFGIREIEALCATVAE